MQSSTIFFNMQAFVSVSPLPFQKHDSLRVNSRSSSLSLPSPISACATSKSTPPTTSISRRAAIRLSLAVAAASLLRANPSISAPLSPKLGEKIENGIYGYSFSAPGSGWTQNVTSLSSGRTVTIFIRDEDSDSNISMVSTPVAGDYAKLTSFGSMDNVVKTIIPPTKKDIVGELISARMDSEKNAYIIEYTVTTKGVTRHLLTVFSLQPSTCLNTLTGQATAELWPKVESEIRAVADSYVLKIT